MSAYKHSKNGSKGSYNDPTSPIASCRRPVSSTPITSNSSSLSNNNIESDPFSPTTGKGGIKYNNNNNNNGMPAKRSLVFFSNGEEEENLTNKVSVDDKNVGESTWSLTLSNSLSHVLAVVIITLLYLNYY